MLVFMGAFIVSGIISIKNNTLIKVFGKGYSFVVTDSMEPTIMVGELIVVEDISYADVINMIESANSEEDKPIIVFVNNNGLKIAHRAIRYDEVQEGIVTKGDNPHPSSLQDPNSVASEDSERVFEYKLLGVVVSHNKAFGIGKFIINSRRWLFITAMIILVIVLVLEIMNVIRHFKEKRDEELKQKFQDEKEKLIEEQRALLKKEIEYELKEAAKKE